MAENETLKIILNKLQRFRPTQAQIKFFLDLFVT